MELPNLNDEQRKQVLMQWREHQHENHEIDFEITPYGDVLKNFAIYSKVWNPNITSARYHASYLFHNSSRLFSEKSAIDMGTGTGLMGVIMGLYGASKVVLTDTSAHAFDNAVENIRKFN